MCLFFNKLLWLGEYDMFISLDLDVFFIFKYGDLIRFYGLRVGLSF